MLSQKKYKAKESTKLKILLIGHLSTNVSGSSLSFKHLLDILKKQPQVEIKVVSTARPAHLTSNFFVNIVLAIKVLGSVICHLHTVDVVSFHASRAAMILYSPVLFLLTRLFQKPLVLRLFGGAFEQEYNKLSSVGRFFFENAILKADLLLLQTKYLVEFFSQPESNNIKWYPTSRQMLELPLSNHFCPVNDKCKRFVFLGRVIEEKGIDTILSSADYLLPGITVDIFGSLDGSYTSDYINYAGKGIIRYMGILTFDQVKDELFNYDALILPTFYPGEGYPGVIIEAYSHGIPVIATQWRSIPEIVDDESGILIPIKSPESLAEAMNRLYSDEEFYTRLKHGVLGKRTQFSDEYWANYFVKSCANISL